MERPEFGVTGTCPSSGTGTEAGDTPALLAAGAAEARNSELLKLGLAASLPTALALLGPFGIGAAADGGDALFACFSCCGVDPILS